VSALKEGKKGKIRENKKGASVPNLKEKKK